MWRRATFSRIGIAAGIIAAALISRETGARFNWPDRRPIGALFLADHSHRSATNPRGWFNSPNLNIKGSAGPAIFREALLAYADRAITILKAVNAQGMIVWDLEGRKPSRTYRGHSGVVTCLAEGDDGALLLSGARDGTLRLWRSGTVSSSLTMKAHGRVSAVSIQEDGGLAVSAGDDRSIKIWDLVNTAPERTIPDAHKDFVSAVEFVPGSSFVLSGSYDRTLKLWDARTGALLRTMTGSERVRSISVSSWLRWV